MNQSKFYKIGLIVMVVLNLVVLVGFYFNSKVTPPAINKNQLAFEKVKKMLDLDEHQFEAFKKTALKHKNRMMQVDEKQKNILQPLFDHYGSNSFNNKDSILGIAANLQKNKIQSTLDHFDEIKAILREDQYDKFELFVKRASVALLSSNGPGGGKKPHKRPNDRTPH